MRRYFANIATPTSLSGDVNDAATSFTVPTTEGYPDTPFVIAIDRGTVDEEVILVQSKTSTTFDDLVRGFDGTTAKAHGNGASIEHISAAIDFDEANAHIHDETRNDHPQYLTAESHKTLDHTEAIAAIAPPVGAIVAFAGGAGAVPAKWLLCDGSQYANAEYPDLFAALGYAYGGDNSTNFAVPDLRARFPLGLDGMGLGSEHITDRVNNEADASASKVRGGVGGKARHQLTTSQIPSHNHTQGSHHHMGHTDHGGVHRHGTEGFGMPNGVLATGLLGTWGNPGTGFFLSFNTKFSGNHRHSFQTQAVTPPISSTGGGLSHPNMTPFQTVLYIVRAE